MKRRLFLGAIASLPLLGKMPPYFPAPPVPKIINLYKVNPKSQTALALGKISLVSNGNNQYSIQPDYYDFNIEWASGFSKRNIATFGAGFLHYGADPIAQAIPLIFGGPYWINFSGIVTIKP